MFLLKIYVFVWYVYCFASGAIQVLRNAVGGGVSAFPENSVTKV